MTNGKPFEVEERLVTQIVAKCTCDTKTPEISFHAVDCTYAAAAMALEVIRLKDERIDDQVAELSRLTARVEESSKLLRQLCMYARTTGGVAGSDPGLMDACRQVEGYLAALTHPAPTPEKE